MTETIIAAMIGAVVTLAVCLINNHFQNRRNQQTYEKTITLIDYKLEELTDKVNKHNNIIERTFKLENQEEFLEKEIERINHRLDGFHNNTNC